MTTTHATGRSASSSSLGSPAPQPIGCGGHLAGRGFLSSPDLFSSDSRRFARGLVLALAAECPEALSALCRVDWHERGQGCFASQVTLRMTGVLMTLAVLRRGLRALVARGLLTQEASVERATITYRATYDRKPPDSVFFPPQAWRGLKPTELAFYAAWAAGGQALSPPEIGERVAGRAGKRLSRSRSYAVFRTLQETGLIPSDPCPQSDRGAVLKTGRGMSLKTPSKSDVLNPDVLKSEDGRGRQQVPGAARGRGAAGLLSLPESDPAQQLDLKLPASPRLRIEEPEMFIDWMAVTGLSSIDLSESPRAASAPARKPACPPAPFLPRGADRAAVGSGSTPDRPTVANRSFVLAAWQAVRTAAGGAFGLHFPLPTDLGVDDNLSMAFARTAIELGDAGATVEQFRVLGQWIAAGYLRWDQERGRPPWKLVCEELRTRMESALAWAASGQRREGERRGGLPQPARATNDDSHLLGATPERRVKGLRDDE